VAKSSIPGQQAAAAGGPFPETGLRPRRTITITPRVRRASWNASINAASTPYPAALASQDAGPGSDGAAATEPQEDGPPNQACTPATEIVRSTPVAGLSRGGAGGLA
jgi:hypothetical protein